MATLVNDRNEFLYSSSTRVTGASVTISPGAATSVIFPKNNVPVPSAVTLTANTIGYVTPAFAWSYRFGDTGTFTDFADTTSSITKSWDSAFLTAAGSSGLVQYKVVVSETSGITGVNQSTYTLSIPIIREGTDGTNGTSGINNVVIRLYQRTTANAAPTVTTTGNSTYTFSTGLVVGQPTNWTQSIPSATGGAYLWMIEVTAASQTNSYQFANTLWSSPVLYSQDGNPGASTALVYAYKRSATAPSDNPGDVTYSFSTNTITTTTLANSWLKTIPAGTDPLYATVATASSTTATDSILAAEWSSPVKFVENGTNSAIVFLYARNSNSSTAPTLTTTGSATYTFSTAALSGTIPSGWTQAIPDAALGSVLWVTQAVASSAGTTDTIANTEWNTPRVLGQNGTNGTDGTRGSRQVYSSDSAYTSTYVYNSNAAGAASYAVKATDLIAAAVSGSLPTTPISGDTVTFSNPTSGSEYVYTITYNGTAWIPPGTIIDGTLLVTGSVTAAKLSSGKISANTIITVGGDDVTAPIVINGTGEIVSNNSSTGDKARFYYGNVEIYKNVPSVGVTLYKALSRVESGVATNGTSVTIPGYFKTQPKIIVSPNNLQMYNATYAGQSQSVNFEASNIVESSTGSMVWSFMPTATLNLSANTGQVNINAASGNQTGSWTSTTYTTAANTSSITMYVNVLSVRGTGTSNTYYYRTVTWKVEYYDPGTSTWVATTPVAVNIGNNITTNVNSNATVTFPSAGAWQIRVAYSAADTGGTFTTGATEYDYLQNTVSRTVNQTVTANSSSNSSASLNGTPTFSPQPGYSVYSVSYSYTYVYNYTIGTFGYITITAPNLFISPTPPPYTYTEYNTQTKTATTTTNSFVVNLSVGTSSAASFTLYTVNATIYTRKPKTNSTTAVNTYTVGYYNYSLSSAQVLATGTLNWIAIGD